LKKSLSFEEELELEEEAIVLKKRAKETRKENCKKKAQMKKKRT